MARADPSARICDHVAAAAPGTAPLAIDVVLDASNGITDALVHCVSCDAGYLIEMLSWKGPALASRTFRVSSVADATARGFRRDLERGSCDLGRAVAQRHALEVQSKLTSLALEIDVDGMKLIRLQHFEPDHDIPVQSWRQRNLGR